MKKFVVLLAVVAMTSFSAMAFAADVTVGGSLEVRSRDFSNLDFNDDAAATGSIVRDTQTRVRIDVNAKAGDVKGKLQLESDYASWGNAGASDKNSNTSFGMREAWVNFNLPGVPANVTAGHQLLSLGNGWFFSSMKNGSDAWVVANQTGNNTLALVDVKFAENNPLNSDDKDAYVILDVLKLSDTATVGVDLTNLKQHGTDLDLKNIGVNFNGKLGPVALKAEADFQMGSFDAANDFAGNQIVVSGAVPAGPVTVNFTVARGSGDDNTADDSVDTYINALDANPHYTLINEYLVGRNDVSTATATAAGKNYGFSNTTALNLGVSAKVLPSLTLAADFWHLMATETVAGQDDAIGQEIDVKANWAVAENLSWNWTAGYFMPGDYYGSNADDAMAIVGVLALKF